MKTTKKRSASNFSYEQNQLLLGVWYRQPGSGTDGLLSTVKASETEARKTCLFDERCAKHTTSISSKLLLRQVNFLKWMQTLLSTLELSSRKGSNSMLLDYLHHTTLRSEDKNPSVCIN